MAQFRKIFWNVRDAFMGMPLLKFGPQSFLFFPVVVGIPTYSFLIFQSSKSFSNTP